MKLATIRFIQEDGSSIDLVTSKDYADGILGVVQHSCNTIGDGWYFPKSWWQKFLEKLGISKRRNGP
ncbi:MAG: hypothetical protein KKH94_06525 [Candidatus Omnitrophica bacterium]|nr:hypothetical protein [Candidatus Omnitrophota bacterium]